VEGQVVLALVVQALGGDLGGLKRGRDINHHWAMVGWWWVESLPATRTARDRSPLSAGCGIEGVPLGICLFTIHITLPFLIIAEIFTRSKEFGKCEALSINHKYWNLQYCLTCLRI
jgi:hypothetical protein